MFSSSQKLIMFVMITGEDIFSKYFKYWIVKNI